MLSVPQAYGGGGAPDFRFHVVPAEELSKVSAGGSVQDARVTRIWVGSNEVMKNASAATWVCEQRDHPAGGGQPPEEM